jgi:superoxide reductase
LTKIKEIYKCEVCGNIVEILHTGMGKLICCGQPMNLKIEKTQDLGNEKHVPIIEKNENGVKVKVGTIEHPMEEKHYIEWIEAMVDGKTIKKYLSPGEKPEMSLCDVEVSGARAYCNIHGLWKSQ